MPSIGNLNMVKMPKRELRCPNPMRDFAFFRLVQILEGIGNIGH
jgi:hypothetical protein